jgi:fosfomycin resistance protein FosX
VIEGLSHITFIVTDLGRTSRLIVDVLGGREVYASGDRTFSIAREKFFVAGGLWIAIMEGEPLPTRTYNHVAFKVAARDLDGLKAKIVALGLEVRESRPRVEGEGASIYFYDWDNHLLELHTGTLDERLARYARDR